jgi:type III restriction enzyme
LLPQVKDLLKKLAGRLEIKNADEKSPVKTRKAILHSEEFKALWDRIKHKTTYRVNFDNEALIRTCAEAIRNSPAVGRTRLTWRKADLSIGRGGIDTELTAESQPVAIEEKDIELPDILTELQDKTQLTRKSIVRILIDSGRLDDFKKNPQEFIEQATTAIKRAKSLAIVDGIKYQRLGDTCFYAQELFETSELVAYMKNMLEVTKSVHMHVVFDSAGVEQSFAKQLEANEAVKVYAKLPGWFTVPTPLGSYNPDWAVLVQTVDGERLYFVVETKGRVDGVLLEGDLRGLEDAKIKCARAHFAALATEDRPAKYVVATKVAELMDT